jgi:hypothetical protein
VVGERQEPLVERAIQGARQLLDAFLARGMQIGTADVADQQRVAGEDEPGLVTAAVIGDQLGVMRRCVSGRGDRLDHRVAQLHQFAIRELVVGELGARALGHVCGRPGALDELR